MLWVEYRNVMACTMGQNNEKSLVWYEFFYLGTHFYTCRKNLLISPYIQCKIITFCTEIFTRILDLCIFSLISFLKKYDKSTFLVKILVYKIIISLGSFFFKTFKNEPIDFRLLFCQYFGHNIFGHSPAPECMEFRSVRHILTECRF